MPSPKRSKSAKVDRNRSSPAPSKKTLYESKTAADGSKVMQYSKGNPERSSSEIVQAQESLAAMRTPFQFAKRGRLFKQQVLREAKIRGHIEAVEEASWEHLNYMCSLGPDGLIEMILTKKRREISIDSVLSPLNNERGSSAMYETSTDGGGELATDLGTEDDRMSHLSLDEDQMPFVQQFEAEAEEHRKRQREVMKQKIVAKHGGPPPAKSAKVAPTGTLTASNSGSTLTVGNLQQLNHITMAVPQSGTANSALPPQEPQRRGGTLTSHQSQSTPAPKQGTPQHKDSVDISPIATKEEQTFVLEDDDNEVDHSKEERVHDSTFVISPSREHSSSSEEVTFQEHSLPPMTPPPAAASATRDSKKSNTSASAKTTISKQPAARSDGDSELANRLKMLEQHVSELSNDNRLLLMTLASSQREVARLSTEVQEVNTRQQEQALNSMTGALVPYSGPPPPGSSSEQPSQRHTRGGASSAGVRPVVYSSDGIMAMDGLISFPPDDDAAEAEANRDPQHVSATQLPSLHPVLVDQITHSIERWRNPFSSYVSDWVGTRSDLPQPAGVAKKVMEVVASGWNMCRRPTLDDDEGRPRVELPTRPPQLNAPEAAGVVDMTPTSAELPSQAEEFHDASDQLSRSDYDDDDDESTKAPSTRGLQTYTPPAQENSIPEMARTEGGRTSPSVVDEEEQGLAATRGEGGTVEKSPESQQIAEEQREKEILEKFLEQEVRNPFDEESAAPHQA